MKKILISLIAIMCVFAFAGCEKVTKGAYKAGTYNGEAVDNSNNEVNTATAKVTVDQSGKITAVYLDTTYKGSTKKTLHDDYNMKTYNPNAAGEWYEQVEKLENAIVENQGIDFLSLDADGKTDAVSGCTININALVEATSNALTQAK